MCVPLELLPCHHVSIYVPLKMPCSCLGKVPHCQTNPNQNSHAWNKVSSSWLTVAKACCRRQGTALERLMMIKAMPKKTFEVIDQYISIHITYHYLRGLSMK